MYQPAPGIWKETPQRRLLWAAKQVLNRLIFEIPEQPKIDDWTLRLERELAKPVLKFNWERWYRQNVQKDDEPNVPEDFAEAWAALPDEIKEKLYRQAGETRTKAIGLPFDERDMRKGLDSTMHMIQGIPESQRGALRRMMEIALREGEGQFGFAKMIRREWREYSARKAEQIAVTEWNRAASVATREGYLRMGVERMQWYTAGDDRVCPICEANSAEGAIPITEQFYSGDFTPPAHPACRCNVSAA